MRDPARAQIVPCPILGIQPGRRTGVPLSVDCEPQLAPPAKGHRYSVNMKTTEPGAPAARIATIMVSAVDAERLAGFWAALLGTAVSSRFDQFVWLQPAGPGAPQLAFQQVDRPTEGRRRLHLDIHGPDPTALRALAESLGAGFVEGHNIGDFHWDVMQDPEGNEFCIAGD